jgi:hypothetical protein
MVQQFLAVLRKSKFEVSANFYEVRMLIDITLKAYKVK